MTFPSTLTLPRAAGLLTICLGLAACDAPATGGSSNAGVDVTAPAERLFVEFCLNKENTDASEAALRASGRFGAPQVSGTATTRVARYPVQGTDGDSITISSGAANGLLCSVNAGGRNVSLFLDGTIVRDS